MGKTALLFAGQGSQYVGMGKDFPDSEGIFDKASEILGFDVLKTCTEAPAEELAQTNISQPCIMACSLAAFYEYKAKNGEFSAVAGHSLGEYAAMTAAGVVSAEDGFRLIKARAEAMQKAANANDSRNAGGAMYAIIGASAAQVEEICAKASGYVVPANYNSPAQIVISGETQAAEAVAAQLAETGAKAIKLNVSSAFHSKIMQPAADEFKQFAETVTFHKPVVSYYSNITGGELTDFTALPALLASHIVSPVRFCDELNALHADGFTEFIELGPGKVLTGLVKKTLGKEKRA